MRSTRSAVGPILLLGLTALAAPCHAQDEQTLEVTAVDYAFDASDETPAGWTTIEYTNEGDEPHFLFLTRMPEGKTLDHYTGELGVAVEEAWSIVREGEGGPQEAGERL